MARMMTMSRSPAATLTLTLMIAMSALAGCKSGGGSNDAASAVTVPSVGVPTVPAPAPAPAPSAPPTSAANTKPTISGAAATTIGANSNYSFTPSSSDADGDQVTFQIENKPSWATFSTVTGQLSGTPSPSHVGTYANVVISASDGKASAALPAFAVTVSDSAAAVSATTLQWTAPTQNTDGTQLTNLAGFIIVYGTSSTSLTKTIRIENPSVDRHQIDDLPAGRHYFGIRAFTSAGVESEVSATVSKVIG
jgi:Putative Ig domain